MVLTTYDADEWVFDAIRSGAAGYLLKDTPREALIAAVKGTVEGRHARRPSRGRQAVCQDRLKAGALGHYRGGYR